MKENKIIVFFKLMYVIRYVLFIYLAEIKLYKNIYYYMIIMIKNIIKSIIILTQIININGLMISKGRTILEVNKNQRQSINILNLKSRVSKNISKLN